MSTNVNTSGHYALSVDCECRSKQAASLAAFLSEEKAGECIVRHGLTNETWALFLARLCLRAERAGRRVHRLQAAGIVVSLFLDPDPAQIVAGGELGADAVELHTGAYANARTEAAIRKRLAELAAGKDLAREHKLVVHAGHGLTYRNIVPVARIEGLCEFNIGHSIVARAVLVGIREATRQMIDLIERSA